MSIYALSGLRWNEERVKWKRRRHNRSRYGIINGAVPLDICPPLSFNSSDELLRTRQEENKKKKKINRNTMNREKRKGIDGGWGWLVCFGSSLISVSWLSVSFFNYSSWFFFFRYSNLFLAKFQKIIIHRK